MSLLAGSVVVCLLLLLSHNSKPETTGKDWKAAYEYCRTQNDSLATIKDVQNNLSKLKGYPSIWSSVRGHFTPWIAYRGCFPITSYPFSTAVMERKKHRLVKNNVGNCYFECKLKNGNYGGCVNNVNFFFGLQESICLCLCDNVIRNQISESDKCHSCGTSLNDGECGESYYFSLYETIYIKLSDAYFGGFCLTCRPQSGSNVNKSVLYSIDCNINATGYCVLKDGDVSSLSTTVSTFVSYWWHCKNNNRYIIGTTSQTFCQKDSSVWTGLRKYRIENSNIDHDICYVIKIYQEIISYKEKNCTANEHFLCKRDVPSVGNIKRTTDTMLMPHTTETLRPTTTFSLIVLTTFFNSAPHPTSATSISASTESKGYITNIVYASTLSSLITSIIDVTNSTVATSFSPKSEGLTAAIIGASIAGVVLLSIVFLIICLLQRRQFQCRQSNQQQAKKAKVFHNTAYDDLVVTNQKQDVTYANVTLENDKQGNIHNKDAIYVEREEEYDHLHTSRQKIKAITQADDDRYGSASYFEDGSYSTLGQEKNVNHDLDNDYSVNIITYSENQSSSVNSAEYDYCYQADQRKDW